MNHQCPKCRREYDAKLNYCPQCGEPSKARLKNSAKESSEISSDSKVTSYMNDFFPPNPRKVEPLSDADDGVRTGERSHSQDSNKHSEPAQESKPGTNDDTASPSPLNPKASDAAYYRSFRTLSRTIIISNAVTSLGVIGVALIFTFSQQRMWNTSQASQVALVNRVLASYEALATNYQTLAATNQTLTAHQETDSKAITQLQAEVVSLQQRQSEVRGKSDEQRLADMPRRLSKKENLNLVSKLDSIAASTRNKQDKRAVLAFKQRVQNNDGDRRAYYQGYVRTLGSLSDQSRPRDDQRGSLFLGD